MGQAAVDDRSALDVPLGAQLVVNQFVQLSPGDSTQSDLVPAQHFFQKLLRWPFPVASRSLIVKRGVWTGGDANLRGWTVDGFFIDFVAVGGRFGNVTFGQIEEQQVGLVDDLWINATVATVAVHWSQQPRWGSVDMDYCDF